MAELDSRADAGHVRDDRRYLHADSLRLGFVLVTGRDILELVARQARAWEENDFDLACQDWLPSGELVAPAGTWPYERLREVMKDFHRSFRDLQITVENVFWSEDHTKVAIEWNWEVTRRSDGKRSLTEDGIIVDLDEGGKIRSWREYFDLSNSVENIPSGRHRSTT